MSNATLEQAAARLLDLMTQGANAAGTAMPEIIEVAGRYLQFRAIGLLMVFVVMALALVWVWGRWGCWEPTHEDGRTGKMLASLPLGAITVVFTVGAMTSLPQNLASALDHRVALVAYVLDNVKR